MNTHAFTIEESSIIFPSRSSAQFEEEEDVEDDEGWDEEGDDW